MVFHGQRDPENSLDLIPHELENQPPLSADGPVHGREIGAHAGNDFLGRVAFHKRREIPKVREKDRCITALPLQRDTA